MQTDDFSLQAFVAMLGFHPWRYSADTYTDGAGRFLDWQKAERILGRPGSALLFSAYDAETRTNHLIPFPAPKSREAAIDAAISVGWLKKGQIDDHT